MGIGTTIRKEIKDLLKSTPSKKAIIIKTYYYTYKELKEALRIEEEITSVSVTQDKGIRINTKEE